MIKKLLSLIVCTTILLCFSACGKTAANGTPPTEDPTSDQTTTIKTTTTITTENTTTAVTTATKTATTITTENTTGPTKNEDTPKAAFDTENITRITFYGYYGAGSASDVPAEHMAEITTWLKSFTIGKEPTDRELPPGTNTYYIEIEYSDGTCLRSGLDVMLIDGTRHLLNKDRLPDCFREIISKSKLPTKP